MQPSFFPIRDFECHISDSMTPRVAVGCDNCGQKRTGGLNQFAGVIKATQAVVLQNC
jgi:hypothetical protein